MYLYNNSSLEPQPRAVTEEPRTTLESNKSKVYNKKTWYVQNWDNQGMLRSKAETNIYA